MNNRTGIMVVAIAAAFFAGSIVAMATADNGAQTAKKKKKKVVTGPAGPTGPQGQQGPKGDKGDAGSPATAARIDYTSGATGTPQQIFTGSGLTLTGTCSAGPDFNLASSGSGTIYVKWTTFSTANDGGNTSGGESDSFTKGAANIGDILLSDDVVADGQIVYDPNGRATAGGSPVTITFHEEESNGGCSFAGTATASG